MASQKMLECLVCRKRGLESENGWVADILGNIFCAYCLYRFSQSEKEWKRFVKLLNISRFCSNCGTRETTQWRRDDNRKTICNACRVYFQRLKVPRPRVLSMNAIKRRKPRNKSILLQAAVSSSESSTAATTSSMMAHRPPSPAFNGFELLKKQYVYAYMPGYTEPVLVEVVNSSHNSKTLANASHRIQTPSPFPLPKEIGDSISSNVDNLPFSGTLDNAGTPVIPQSPVVEAASSSYESNTITNATYRMPTLPPFNPPQEFRDCFISASDKIQFSETLDNSGMLGIPEPPIVEAASLSSGSNTTAIVSLTTPPPLSFSPLNATPSKLTCDGLRFPETRDINLGMPSIPEPATVATANSSSDWLTILTSPLYSFLDDIPQFGERLQSSTEELIPPFDFSMCFED